MNLTFILQDKSVKRRIESQVQSVLSNVITRSFLKTPVEVVVVSRIYALIEAPICISVYIDLHL